MYSLSRFRLSRLNFSLQSTFKRHTMYPHTQIECRLLSSAILLPPPPPPRDGIDWDSLGFSLTTTDSMYVSKAKRGEPIGKGTLQPFGPLDLTPAASIISYGQGLFEGMKAFRTVNDRIVLFRPTENAKRMNNGAARFLMSPVPENIFIDAIECIVKDNASYVPPTNQGALYIRPCLFGSGSNVGVGPSSEYTLAIYCTPVGPYFKGGLTGINLKACGWHHRAAPKGCGDVKAAGNYAPCFKSQKKVKDEGFHEALYLDAIHEQYIEEAGASNFFCVTADNCLHTPGLGHILPGITRMTVIELAKEMGYTVIEGPLHINQAMEAKEAFCAGTGASITPVGSITNNDQTVVFNDGKVGEMTKKIFDTITSIQLEQIPDKHGWIHDVYG